MLSAFVWLPLVGVIVLSLLPKTIHQSAYRLVALIVAIALLVWTALLGLQFDPQQSGMQFSEYLPWIKPIGLNYHLGVDGLSWPMLCLNSFLTVLAIWASERQIERPRLYYALLLLLNIGVSGAFLAQDMLLFFLFYELELIPLYFLIAIWGGQRRAYAAMKFLIYTAISGILLLATFLGVVWLSGANTFDYQPLRTSALPLESQILLLAGLLIAFGIKIPFFPLHTWLPDAHGEASAPVSMILAGVLLKMGGYGLIRMNIEMLPNAHLYFAPALAILGVVNNVYGALNAFAQDNLKRRLACSSISHMGFVLLGIAAMTELGISGAVLQMLSHGLIAAALFFLSGVTYERTHTLAMAKMSGMAKSMPKVFALFTAASMASLALPGMSGFVGELTVFLGIASSDIYTTSFKLVVILLAAVGLILTPIYLLSMLRVVFYGKDMSKDINALEIETWMDAKPREVLITVCLLLPIIGIGLYPKLVTQTYDVKTTQVAEEIRQTMPVFAGQQERLFSGGFVTPKLSQSDTVIQVGQDA